MKVLVAHNRYRSDMPSGENIVVDAEIASLRAAGVDVVPMITESDSVSLRSPAGLAAAALGPVYAPGGVPRFRELLTTERPDVVHLHNVYPLLSPWVVRTAHHHGVPVVQTVHNFRHDCVAGSYFRNGAICTECAGRAFASPAIAHGCYRGSHAQSVPMAVGRSVHRSTWRSVERFLALTPFHAEFLRSLGVPPERIVVRPTSAPDPGEPAPPTSKDVLFAGRLDEQKGIRLLLDAWRTREHPSGGMLRIVGDGPLRELVEDAASRDASVVAYGRVEADAVADRIRAAGAVIIPSTWFEGLPRVLVEALSHGRTVAVSDIGGLGAVVDDRIGWRFAPTVQGVRAGLDALATGDLRARGLAARETYLASYAPDVTTHALLAVYDDVSRSPR